MADNKVDVHVSNQGTIFTFWPVTDAAKEWIDENVPDDSQWFGPKLVVEWRYAYDLADGMEAAGLILK